MPDFSSGVASRLQEVLAFELDPQTFVFEQVVFDQRARERSDESQLLKAELVVLPKSFPALGSSPAAQAESNKRFRRLALHFLGAA